MEKINWSDEVLGRVGEKKNLLNNIVRKKEVNWIGNIL